jgi:hypothetical protein
MYTERTKHMFVSQKNFWESWKIRKIWYSFNKFTLTMFDWLDFDQVTQQASDATYLFGVL